MSNFKEGDVVIIKPGTQYDGSYLSNPNYKIGVGIIISLNIVKWFNKKGEVTKNNYIFNRDLLLLSEHEEASEFWKQLPEKLSSELEHYKILEKVNKSKIYFKSDIKVKNVDDILNKLLIKNLQSSTSSLNTYYKYENIEYLQCEKNRYRSFDDILLICRTYFPSTKVETVFKKLLLLNNKKSLILNDNVKCQFRYCSTINRIRYVANYNATVSYFYNTAISSSCGNSKYSWKDLFKMININNVEELKQFYLKNLKE